MQYIGLVFASLAVASRRMAGRCYPPGHPLRAFHRDMADLLADVRYRRS